MTEHEHDEVRECGFFGVVRHEVADPTYTATPPTEFTAPESADFTFGLKNWEMQGNAEYANCFEAMIAHAQMAQGLKGTTQHGKPSYETGFKPPSATAAVGWYHTYEKEQGASTEPPGNGTSIYGGVALLLKLKLAHYAGIVNGPFTAELTREAIYDFQGGAGFCLALDKKAQQEFADHVKWGTDSTKPDAEMGHAVDGVAYDPSGITFITWASTEGSTDEFDLNCIDGIVLLITEGFIIKNGEVAADALAEKWGLTKAS